MSYGSDVLFGCSSSSVMLHRASGVCACVACKGLGFGQQLDRQPIALGLRCSNLLRSAGTELISDIATTPQIVTGEKRATIPLKGKITEDSVTELLKAEKLPPTIEFNDKNSQKIFNSGVGKQVGLGLGFQGFKGFGFLAAAGEFAARVQAAALLLRPCQVEVHVCTAAAAGSRAVQCGEQQVKGSCSHTMVDQSICPLTVMACTEKEANAGKQECRG